MTDFSSKIKLTTCKVATACESLTFVKSFELMAGFLFDDLVFGPLSSRRLGKSLGINLLPTYTKSCSFNCIYCECGWTRNRHSLQIELPSRAEIYKAIEQKLLMLANTPNEPDSLTFAGNGEPTMHPEFPEIVNDVLLLRNSLIPKAKVSVLSNGSRIHQAETAEALKRVDNNILKLDGGNEAIIRTINLPLKAFRLKDYVSALCSMRNNLMIQTLFLRGKFKNKAFDNTLPTEVNDWLELLVEIKPRSVMLYSLDRETPAHELEKIPFEVLEDIAKRVRNLGIRADVYA